MNTPGWLGLVNLMACLWGGRAWRIDGGSRSGDEDQDGDEDAEETQFTER